MSSLAFISGVMASLFAGVIIVLYRRPIDRPNRMIPAEARKRRTLDQQARALAFATLYAKYADREYPHFVLAQDRELVANIVTKFIRENRDRLGEMYLGPEFFLEGEDRVIETTVDRAVELFLQI
ncbi:MAG: hypothetical protein P4L40_06580 [Terracidiphilus sp.]|nr:hypothetical protein [Terracidiphilus sp.]